MNTLKSVVANIENYAEVVGADIDPLGSVGVMLWKAADAPVVEKVIRQEFAEAGIEIKDMYLTVGGAYFVIRTK